MQKIHDFDWDHGNREKCQKHGVSIAEIEDLFSRPIMILSDHRHSLTEKRSLAIGKTSAGRYVFLVFTIRTLGKDYIRPISARYMHQREIDSYEKDNPDL